MSYLRPRALSGAAFPGMFPGFPGGLPGAMPGPFSPGFVPGPTPGVAGGVSLFPTSFRWGDVVTVMGPFAGMFQGQVIVRLQGVPGGIGIAMTGPGGGSFVVPDGAQTGSCTVEVNGQQVFGRNCVVTPAEPTQGRPAEHKAIRSWHGVGDVTTLALLEKIGFSDRPAKGSKVAYVAPAPARGLPIAKIALIGGGVLGVALLVRHLKRRGR